MILKGLAKLQKQVLRQEHSKQVHSIQVLKQKLVQVPIEEQLRQLQEQELVSLLQLGQVLVSQQLQVLELVS